MSSPYFTMRLSDGTNIVEYGENNYDDYRAYSAIPGFYEDFEFPSTHPISYATCGGGNCFSNGLKKCVKCGSTSKPKPKPKPKAKPKCNLTSSICKKNNSKASSCSVTSKCVCNCKFPEQGGKTSLDLAKDANKKMDENKAKAACNLTPQTCFTNSPRASKCGVTHFKAGGCSCNCTDKATGKRLGPAPKADDVEKEDAPVSTTGGLLPGQLPGTGQVGKAATIRAYKENVNRAIANKDTKALSVAMIQATQEWNWALTDLRAGKDPGGVKWDAAKTKWKTAFYGKAYIANPNAFNVVSNVFNDPEAKDVAQTALIVATKQAAGPVGGVITKLPGKLPGAVANAPGFGTGLSVLSLGTVAVVTGQPMPIKEMFESVVGDSLNIIQGIASKVANVPLPGVGIGTVIPITELPAAQQLVSEKLGGPTVPGTTEA